MTMVMTNSTRKNRNDDDYYDYDDNDDDDLGAAGGGGSVSQMLTRGGVGLKFFQQMDVMAKKIWKEREI